MYEKQWSLQFHYWSVLWGSDTFKCLCKFYLTYYKNGQSRTLMKNTLVDFPSPPQMPLDGLKQTGLPQCNLLTQRGRSDLSQWSTGQQSCAGTKTRKRAGSQLTVSHAHSIQNLVSQPGRVCLSPLHLRLRYLTSGHGSHLSHITRVIACLVIVGWWQWFWSPILGFCPEHQSL